MLKLKFAYQTESFLLICSASQLFISAYILIYTFDLYKFFQIDFLQKIIKDLCLKSTYQRICYNNKYKYKNKHKYLSAFKLFRHSHFSIKSNKYLLNKIGRIINLSCRNMIKLKQKNVPKHFIQSYDKYIDLLGEDVLSSKLSEADANEDINICNDFLEQIYKFIQKWQISTFRIPQTLQASNNSFEVVKSISHITFGQLKYLDLTSSKIFSLEPMSWLDCQGLQEIELDQNNITSLKPLSKTIFMHLSWMTLKPNFITPNQLEYLTRMKTKKYNIKYIDFAFESNHKNDEAGLNINGLFKFEAENIERANIKEKFLQKRVVNLLNDRFLTQKLIKLTKSGRQF